MPNWCYNNVTLRHTDPAIISRAAAAMERGELLQEFIPCPAELKDTVSGFMGKDTPAQTALEDRQASNIATYGFPTWYEFCIEKWGCKWDVEGQVVSQDENTVELSFDSAWAPPIEAYRELSDLGFEVVALYYEPGMGFCGQFTTDDDDDYYNIEGDSDWVSENIPRHIDEAFAIGEQMSDYESEEDYYEDDSDDQGDDESDDSDEEN